MAEFDPGWPSIRQVQGYIQDKQAVEIKLLTGDVLTGQIFWQDPLCLCLIDAEKRAIAIQRPAIAYLKPV